MKPIASALVAAAFCAGPVPLAAQQAAPPAGEGAPLSLEHRMMLRCSAAFALGAQLQAAGAPEAQEWRPLAEVGREFFVRAAARVMDVAGLDRNDIAREVTAEAMALQQGDNLEQVIPVCLSLLPDEVP